MFKSQEKLIAEIHNEFDTAQDRLLKEATELLDSLANTDKLENVASRLIKAGFTNTPTVSKTSKLTREKTVAREQAELVQYYKQTYPFLKFLTEAELDRICEKYSLVFARSDRYIKEVPEKNLRDIEQAQELKEDDMINRDQIRLERERREENMQYRSPELYMSDLYFLGNGRATTDRLGLFIAAPGSHFNLRGLVKTSKFGWGKPEVKDPIVFRYVRGGIQVLTKWGTEGEDPSLVVEKLN